MGLGHLVNPFRKVEAAFFVRRTEIIRQFQFHALTFHVTSGGKKRIGSSVCQRKNTTDGNFLGCSDEASSSQAKTHKYEDLHGVFNLIVRILTILDFPGFNSRTQP